MRPNQDFNFHLSEQMKPEDLPADLRQAVISKMSGGIKLNRKSGLRVSPDLGLSPDEDEICIGFI